MKRLKLVKYLKSFNCYLLREGSRHSVFKNQTNGQLSTVPRHKEIKDQLASKICKDLDIPDIKKPQSKK